MNTLINKKKLNDYYKMNLAPLLPVPAVMASSMPVRTDPRWSFIPTGNDILENTSLTFTCRGVLPVSVNPTLSFRTDESDSFFFFFLH